ncbi:MAG: DUF350 domain-containing protein [Gammaproteobacteria bacterium]|nr:DUF350 domain-containing protein [Gammaproteobacteria bacterium]
MENFINIDAITLGYYFLDFIVVVAMLAGVKLMMGLVASVSNEQSRQANPALGIAKAGAIIAIAIMLMGVLSGDISTSLLDELILILVYGVSGIFLMWLTRIVFDRISLPHISIQSEIMKGNIAAGLVDAGNMIATAIIIRAVMTWVDGSALSDIFMVLGGFLLSQILLLLATLYRSKLFVSRHPGGSIHQEIEKNNIALALRFSGYRIGVALAVTAASGMVAYIEDSLTIQAVLWFVVACIMFLLLTGAAAITRKVVLAGVDVALEVDKQKNVAVGAIEAAIYLAIGFLLAGLFA